MRACSSPASATSFQYGLFRFIASGTGDSASSRRNLSPLIRFPRTRLVCSLSSSFSHSSDSQIELDPITEAPPRLSDQDDVTTVRIKINMHKQCRFGEQFFVVGDQPELGLWNTLNAVPMIWSRDDLWIAQLDVSIGEPVQFKFILREISGKFLWQPGEDRVLHTWKTSNIISVFEDWKDADARLVTEEQAVNNDYKESDEAAYEALPTVADTNSDMDTARSEEQLSSIQDDSFPSKKTTFDVIAEISGSQVVDEKLTLHSARDEESISDSGLIASDDVLEEKDDQMLVHGLNRCPTTPNEDVTVNKEELKTEKAEEQVKGHSELEKVNGWSTFYDEYASFVDEHRFEITSKNDEDVNSHPEQDLELALSKSQSNKDSDTWYDDIKWPGQEVIKRFFNSLGLL